MDEQGTAKKPAKGSGKQKQTTLESTAKDHLVYIIIDPSKLTSSLRGKNSRFTKFARSADAQGKIVVALSLPRDNMDDMTEKGTSPSIQLSLCGRIPTTRSREANRWQQS